jgi:hypothetical protein
VHSTALLHLREFHSDRVKIDRSFVQAMLSDPESGKIVDATCHGLAVQPLQATTILCKYFVPAREQTRVGPRSDPGHSRPSIAWISTCDAQATREFVCNLATRDLAEQLNQTSIEAGPEVDQFVLAGLPRHTGPAVDPR